MIIDSAVDSEHKEPDNVEEDTTENKINNINSHLVVIVGEDDEVADQEVDEVDHQPGNKEGRLGWLNPRQAEDIDSEEDPHHEHFRGNEQVIHINGCCCFCTWKGWLLSKIENWLEAEYWDCS